MTKKGNGGRIASGWAQKEVIPLKEGNKEGNNSCGDEKRAKRKMREKRENLRFRKKIEW